MKVVPQHIIPSLAVEALDKSVTAAVGAAGITVKAASPGPTERAFFRTNNPVSSEGDARYLSGLPTGRFGEPDEIAATIASDDAAFMTGQTLIVDAGAYPEERRSSVHELGTPAIVSGTQNTLKVEKSMSSKLLAL